MLAGPAPPEGSREGSSPASFRLGGPHPFLGFWQHDSSSYCNLHIAVVPVWLQCLCWNFILLIRTRVISLGPILVQYGLVLTLLHLQRPWFQIRSHAELLGGQKFKGHYSPSTNSCNNHSDFSHQPAITHIVIIHLSNSFWKQISIQEVGMCVSTYSWSTNIFSFLPSMKWQWGEPCVLLW